MPEYGDYSSANEDTDKYCLKWITCNSSIKNGNFEIQNAFSYTTAEELDSLPTYGIYDYYNGGGYVYKMMRNINQSYDDIETLFENEWIDRKTRTLFVEFTLHNPNVNLFALCSILFEFLPTGKIIVSSTFDTFDLFNASNYQKQIAEVAYIIVTVAFMLIEIKKIIKLQKNYFNNALNIFEWVLYSFSLVSLVIFLFEINAVSQILNIIKTNSINANIRLQHIKYFNDLITICFAFCSFFGFIKMIKLLEKSRSIFILITSIKVSMIKLTTFIIFLVLLYTTFSQIFYLILNDQLNSFSSFLKTLEKLFQMTLGKFDSGIILKASPIIGVFLMFFFNTIVVLILLNLFFSIIGESLLETKKSTKIESLDFYNSIKKKLILLSKTNRRENNITYKPEPLVEEYCVELIKTFDKLNKKI